jgi:inorganic pyrophosphatase
VLPSGLPEKQKDLPMQLLQKAAAVFAAFSLIALSSADSPAPQPAPVPLGASVSKANEETLASSVNFLDGIPSLNADGTANLVVEIPAGTNEKWEVKQDGVMHWDLKDGKPRVVKYLPYLGNYGEIPRTRQVDGDPIDLIALGPAFGRGSVVPTRIIGVAKFTDKGETDDKLLGVVPGTPLGDVTSLKELNEKFPGVADIIKTWFSYYKGPDGGGMAFQGFGDEKTAMELLEVSRKAYDTAHATK